MKYQISAANQKKELVATNCLWNCMNDVNTNLPSVFYHQKQEKTTDVNILIVDIII